MSFASAVTAGDAENANYTRVATEDQFRALIVGKTWRTKNGGTSYLLKADGTVRGKWRGKISRGRWRWVGDELRTTLVTDGERERERIEVFISTNGRYVKERNLTQNYTVYYYTG